MTKNVELINTASDTWQVLIDTVNELANVASQFAVTVEPVTNGSISTGNGFVIGTFGSQVLVTNELRGGNVQSSDTLTITSNVSVGNTTSNVQIGTGTLVIGNTVANSSSIDSDTVTSRQVTAGNTSMNTTAFAVGNARMESTIIVVGNVTINATTFFTGSITINSTAMLIGNSTANVVINSTAIVIANSTANTVFVPGIIDGGTF